MSASPSAASSASAAPSAPPLSPFSSPAPADSPPLYPLADYLLHIDADELASNMHFAEHLAQHINDRLLLHAQQADHSTTHTAGTQSTAQTSRLPSLLSLPASSATAASLSSSSLSAPGRLPSLLSSTGSRGALSTEAGSGAEVSLPPLTDDEYNAMLDELISSTTLAEAVVVEGPALLRMEQEEDEAEEAADEEEGRDEEKRASSDEQKEAGREMDGPAQTDGVRSSDAEGKEGHEDGDAELTATPRTVTVIGATSRQSEREMDQSAPPHRRQSNKTTTRHQHTALCCSTTRLSPSTDCSQLSLLSLSLSGSIAAVRASDVRAVRRASVVDCSGLSAASSRRQQQLWHTAEDSRSAPRAARGSVRPAQRQQFAATASLRRCTSRTTATTSRSGHIADVE